MFPICNFSPNTLKDNTMARFIIKIFAGILTMTSIVFSSSALARESWPEVKSIDVKSINKDIKVGDPTVDVGIYYASNFDEKFQKAVPLSGIMEEFMTAKKLYAKNGVYLKLLWVKSGKLDSKNFSIQTASLQDSKPNDNYVNMYRESERQPNILSKHARETFESIIEPDKYNSRTIYLIALQGVYMSYNDGDEKGRNWNSTLVRTGGLSFPSYMHGDTIPKRIRGVITLSRYDDVNKKIISHELGHKLMNVSHEYMEISPQHEVRKPGGLMLYGTGMDIPSGEEGRWHRERLHLSPYIYRINKSGKRIWNEDYKEQGFYYDSLYGDKVMQFDGVRKKR